MKVAKDNKYYYGLTCGGCACGLIGNQASSMNNALLFLFDECIETGELIIKYNKSTCYRAYPWEGLVDKGGILPADT